MRQSFFLLLLIIASVAKANDSIEVKINQVSFGAKDSILFSCKIHDYAAQGLAAATLNVWIQDIEKKQTWKFRYPVVNGEADGALAISDSIPPGKYAVNFILQKGLYKIQGMLRNNESYKKLNYLMMLKSNKKLVNNVDVSESGAFLIKNILFEERSFIVFTPEKKVKKNDLFITITTPLDSAFTPIAVFTHMVDIKPELQKKAPVKTPEYKFDFTQTYLNTTLPEVVVTSKMKSKVDQYNDLYSTGLFQDNNAKVFDGLDNDDIATSIDIETFLQSKVPGLIVNRPDGGNAYMVWRNEPVVVYVDEFRLEQGEPIFVSPSEVAMIKVYPPPAAINSGISNNPDNPRGAGFSGAVAIYTRRGAFENNATRRYKFNLKGYSPGSGIWK